MLWGCRYVHSMINPSTGLPTHLDGAIRIYNDEEILKRIDSKTDISKYGKNSSARFIGKCIDRRVFRWC